ncbi:DUF6869 domain-containing protein [Lysobacter capsici]|uniref:DUF6869 domain-containing protein n=1 Tax=Lysobacter capsici TaxID=435897 RepID=UPI001C007634|nr:hypothetical protein [Lysobacter capsici]QWF18312.1 hypothetical protein KME82_05995 [Lysobacter capsici]
MFGGVDKMADAWLLRLKKITGGELDSRSDGVDETDWVLHQLQAIISRDKNFDLIVEFVNNVLEKDSSEYVMDNLAAGPIESMIFKDEAMAVRVIIGAAKKNDAFRRMLDGVWQNNVSSEFWALILNAKK